MDTIKHVIDRIEQTADKYGFGYAEIFIKNDYEDFKVKFKQIKPSEKKYIICYTSKLDELCKHHVLYCILCQIVRSLPILSEDNRDLSITINKDVRKKLADKCGVKENTVVKTIKTMLDMNVMKRVSVGTYWINPSYAARGTWENVWIAQQRYDSLKEEKNV